MRSPAHRFPTRLSILTLLLATAWGELAWAKVDMLELSLEQLMDVEVVSASRFAQKTSDAPSAVTVLHGEDFRAYGWHNQTMTITTIAEK